VAKHFTWGSTTALFKTFGAVAVATFIDALISPHKES